MSRKYGLTGNIVILAVLMAAPSGLRAQDDLVPEKQLEEKKKKEGWDFLLTPSASAALSDNRSVIGQQEGLTITLGASLASGAFFREGSHEWRATLDINEMFAQTPALDEFVKTTDIFKFKTVYLFHLIDWLGPFAKATIDTAMLEGFDARAEPTQWTITYNDGSVVNRSGFHLRLTDGFEPLTLKETAGFFAKPVESKKLNVEGRVGFGGMHVFADGGLAVQDDGATEAIDVLELKDVNQAGAVIELEAFGELYDKKIIYKAGAEFMIPFVTNLEEGDNRGAGELTNIELTASLSFKVLEWLSIDYVFRAVKQPQLLDEFQIQNNLLLTASYTFFKPEEEKK